MPANSPSPQATIVIGYDETTSQFIFTPQEPMSPWQWDADDESISPEQGQADVAKTFAFQAASGWILGGFRVGPTEAWVDDATQGDWYNATGYLGPQCLTIYGTEKTNYKGSDGTTKDAYGTLVVDETNRPPHDQNPEQRFYYSILLVKPDGTEKHWDDPKIYEKPED